MSNQISINKDTVIEVRKRITIFLEESEETLKNAERSVYDAELEGWNDYQYKEFLDMYLDVQQNITNELKRMDEDIIPFLRKLEISIDDFFV